MCFLSVFHSANAVHSIRQKVLCSHCAFYPLHTQFVRALSRNDFHHQIILICKVSHRRTFINTIQEGVTAALETSSMLLLRYRNVTNLKTEVIMLVTQLSCLKWMSKPKKLLSKQPADPANNYINYIMVWVICCFPLSKMWLYLLNRSLTVIQPKIYQFAIFWKIPSYYPL